ncbi:MAG: MBL fold metallo-hydrolase [Candidatus Hydrogenedentes bacterium]|nr:MBL fold metallo-hydrolase [Candidatus Hydrogenedentota bacterium]
MIVQSFLLDVNEANAYVVACEQTREALLIDAGELNASVEAFLRDQDLRLTRVFITHDHFDHTGGLREIIDKHRAEVFAANHAVGNCTATNVSHGDEIPVGSLVGKVVVTPGHTPDGISLIFPGVVFVGDALFAGSVGGTATNALARQQIDHIRRNIFSLPPEYELHGGHGPASTVQIESRYNPFFL